MQLLELGLVNFCSEILSCILKGSSVKSKAPIESILKDVPRHSPVFNTLAPKQVADTIHGHARRLSIEKLIASTEMDSHLIHSLGEGKDTDTDSSSALVPDDNPND
jgi:hypothetical protein